MSHSAFRVAFLKLVDQAQELTGTFRREHQQMMDDGELDALSIAIEFEAKALEYAAAFRARNERESAS